MAAVQAVTAYRLPRALVVVAAAAVNKVVVLNSVELGKQDKS
jgi:putative ribosome biogenesis GTPase RsgA